MLKKLIILLLLFLLAENSNAAESQDEKFSKHDWSFDGITGTFDRSALQRGFKVFREVCSGCHSIRLIYYRDLIDIGFTAEQVKVIASEYTVIDGPNDEGEMFERSAKPADKFYAPYRNENEARANNNGAYPPDLSVITKAKSGGVDYIYNLLLGYADIPENIEVGEGMYYNKWMPGHQIAMPNPFFDGLIEYDDGTEATISQMAEDVTTFLKWTAEPELEERKNMGVKVILFFIIIGFIVFLLKRKLWRSVH